MFWDTRDHSWTNNDTLKTIKEALKAVIPSRLRARGRARDLRTTAPHLISVGFIVRSTLTMVQTDV